MHLNIDLQLRPSVPFVGILAELNGEFADWTDGSYDWANQTTDFLHGTDPLPQFREGLFTTPFSQRALNDLLQMSIALLSGNYPAVRQYLQDTRFALVIGYPRSGGSYLTKELLRTLGLDHTRVSETLAHDGFPELCELWYDWNGNRPYYHLEESIFQVAEYLVIARLYFQANSPQGRKDTG